VYIADDGRSHLNLVVDGHPENLVVNGRPLSTFEGSLLGSLTISSDGKHVAYRIGWAVVVEDGHAVENRYKGLGPVTISPDGNHLAYSAYGAVKGTWFTVVVDGKTTQEAQSNFFHLGYNEISTILFSPDSKRLAYVGSKGKMMAVVDGKADEECKEIRNLQFSADSKHVAYEAKRDKLWSVVVDGHAGSEYEGIAGLRISPDGKHVAYAAAKSKSDQWQEIVEDWEYGEGAGHAIRTVEIGSAGAMISHYLKQFNGLTECTPGQTNGLCTYVTLGSTASFSPDGKRVAYLSVPDKQEKSPFSVIVDGKASPRFNEAVPPVFSPDGKHVAYPALTEVEVLKKYTWSKADRNEYSANNWSTVLDGQPGPKYILILDGSLAFGSDGTLEFLAIKWKGELSLFRVKYIPTP
jgi:WD40 repeat protein